jgi:hypothetical protein
MCVCVRHELLLLGELFNGFFDRRLEFPLGAEGLSEGALE